ncbi:uncharacterized protein LOC144628649 [Oculina patagonica]
MSSLRSPFLEGNHSARENGQPQPQPRDGGQGFVLSHNGLPFEPSADHGTSAQEQQSGYDETNDEQGSGPSPPDKETDQAVGQRINGDEQQPSYQQGDAQQENGWSVPVQEMEQIADQTVNAHERQPVHRQVDGRRGSGSNYSPMLNGVEASEASSSSQEAELVADQLVNGPQQQMLFQQGGGAEANGVNYPTQETDLHSSQRPAAPEYQPPYQEAGGDQACGYNYPVQETGQVAVQLPDEHEDLPPCYQQLNGFHINGVSSTGQTEQAIEHSCSRQELQLWNQKLARSNPQKATRKKMNPSETFHIVEITEVQQLRQVDANGVAPAFFSSAIYTDSYEYKLGIRLYLNGVGDGSGRYVSLFVHMMKGEYDDFLHWPYTGTVTLSIMDRSDARHNDISQIVQATPNSSAFQRPREAICRKGCGFVKFALIEKVFGPQYVKDDKLFLKIEFST